MLEKLKFGYYFLKLIKLLYKEQWAIIQYAVCHSAKINIKWDGWGLDRAARYRLCCYHYINVESSDKLVQQNSWSSNWSRRA